MLDDTDRRGFMKAGAAVLIAAIWGSSPPLAQENPALGTWTKNRLLGQVIGQFTRYGFLNERILTNAPKNHDM
jgi:hypothetical protein